MTAAELEHACDVGGAAWPGFPCAYPVCGSKDGALKVGVCNGIVQPSPLHTYSRHTAPSDYMGPMSTALASRKCLTHVRQPQLQNL